MSEPKGRLMLGSSPRQHESALHLGYGQPTPGAGARVMRTWPVRAWSVMFSGPRHSATIMNSVCLFTPPSMHAKQLRSRGIVVGVGWSGWNIALPRRWGRFSWSRLRRPALKRGLQ